MNTYKFNPEELKTRTKNFALRNIKLFQSLPKTDEAKIIGKQLLRSSTSIAANYRAVCRSRSKAEFIAKIGIVVEEADETLLWLEFLMKSSIVPESRIKNLYKEGEELLQIMSSSRKTAKSNSTTH